MDALFGRHKSYSHFLFSKRFLEVLFISAGKYSRRERLTITRRGKSDPNKEIPLIGRQLKSIAEKYFDC